MSSILEACVDCALRCSKIHVDRAASTSSFSFFKILVTSSFFKFLHLPPTFSYKVLKDEGNVTWLKDVNGKEWRVKISLLDGSLAFVDGWTKFVTDHALAHGELLVFTYIPSLCFMVRIYGTSSLERTTFSDARNGVPSSQTTVKKAACNVPSPSYPNNQVPCKNVNGKKVRFAGVDAEIPEQKRAKTTEHALKKDKTFGGHFAGDEGTQKHSAKKDSDGKNIYGQSGKRSNSQSGHFEGDEGTLKHSAKKDSDGKNRYVKSGKRSNSQYGHFEGDEATQKHSGMKDKDGQGLSSGKRPNAQSVSEADDNNDDARPVTFGKQSNSSFNARRKPQQIINVLDSSSEDRAKSFLHKGDEDRSMDTKKLTMKVGGLEKWKSAQVRKMSKTRFKASNRPQVFSNRSQVTSKPVPKKRSVDGNVSSVKIKDEVVAEDTSSDDDDDDDDDDDTPSSYSSLSSSEETSDSEFDPCAQDKIVSSYSADSSTEEPDGSDGSRSSSSSLSRFQDVANEKKIKGNGLINKPSGIDKVEGCKRPNNDVPLPPRSISSMASFDAVNGVQVSKKVSLVKDRDASIEANIHSKQRQKGGLSCSNDEIIGSKTGNKVFPTNSLDQVKSHDKLESKKTSTKVFPTNCSFDKVKSHDKMESKKTSTKVFPTNSFDKIKNHNKMESKMPNNNEGNKMKKFMHEKNVSSSGCYKSLEEHGRIDVAPEDDLYEEKVDVGELDKYLGDYEFGREDRIQTNANSFKQKPIGGETSSSKGLKTCKLEQFESSISSYSQCSSTLTENSWLELSQGFPSLLHTRWQHLRAKLVINLRDPAGRYWPVFYHEALGRRVLNSGWSEFAAANGLNPGDVCSFQPLFTDDSEAMFEVHIVSKA